MTHLSPKIDPECVVLTPNSRYIVCNSLADRGGGGTELMRMRKAVQTDTYTAPESRSDLHQWVRDRMPLSTTHEQALHDAIDAVFVQHERRWQQSKEEAIQAIYARLHRAAEPPAGGSLSARDATVSSIARYFEDLVADLTDRVHRNPKTRLMNSRRFFEQLEAFLALEQRGQWCAVGLVDIHALQESQRHARARNRRPDHRTSRPPAARARQRSDDLIARESLDNGPGWPGAARTLWRR